MTEKAAAGFVIGVVQQDHWGQQPGRRTLSVGEGLPQIGEESRAQDISRLIPVAVVARRVPLLVQLHQGADRVVGVALVAVAEPDFVAPQEQTAAENPRGQRADGSGDRAAQQACSGISGERLHRKGEDVLCDLTEEIFDPVEPAVLLNFGDHELACPVAVRVAEVEAQYQFADGQPGEADATVAGLVAAQFEGESRQDLGHIRLRNVVEVDMSVGHLLTQNSGDLVE
ncbi:hypothetical protein [Nocardiopsis rhodophaea]|uniref:hypothetical protein n=1 Tax=Nocardiopsis rhodophaea TaxID=280238 RepID=UPI0031DD726C